LSKGSGLRRRPGGRTEITGRLRKLRGGDVCAQRENAEEGIKGRRESCQLWESKKKGGTGTKTKNIIKKRLGRGHGKEVWGTVDRQNLQEATKKKTTACARNRDEKPDGKLRTIKEVKKGAEKGKRRRFQEVAECECDTPERWDEGGERKTPEVNGVVGRS